MAFRATNIAPADGYATVKRAASQLKVNLEDYGAQTLVDGADYHRLLAIYSLMYNANAQFDTLKVIPGMADYAKEAENDPTYDVVAEFASLQTAIASALAWLDANVPLTGRTLKSMTDQIEATTPVSDTFTVGQTAGLRTEMAAVVAEIV